MTDSKFKPQVNRDRRQLWRIRLATLVMVGIVTLFSLVMTGWFAGQSQLEHGFARLEVSQEHPPLWLAVPMVAKEYLLLPTVALFLGVMAVMKISPQPRVWSRRVVVLVLLVLTGRYVLWRMLSTLNLADPLNGIFSLWLFSLEMLMLLSSSIQMFLMLNVKDRRGEADRYAVAVIDGSFTPSVDIFIPTYNEPTFILQRTIIGCQALDYPHKKIYLLDDTQRLEVRQMAQELGCQYLTRPNRLYAKAGNLNQAISQTDGQLIVIFDADFVPTTNFLVRTVGFFQDRQIALVQTPQSFYNADPIARNLGLENVVTPEEEVFYRQIQPLKDGAGSVICSGTSFVVRRSALQAAGGFVTDSLSEDYFTGIRLSALGYQLVYLDEKLSAGLAAETIAAHVSQRLRWVRGTLQAFFIDANPLTIPGLRPLQRLAHLEGLLHWFTSISRVGFLLIPLAYSFLGAIPIRATPHELLYFFLPYYSVQLTVFSWLNHRSRSALLSDIYSLVLCFPLALTVIQVMLSPFSSGFQVTLKGQTRDRFSFNWNLAWPLLLLSIVTAVGLWRHIEMWTIKGTWQTIMPAEIARQVKGIGLGWLWSCYNLLMVGIALLTLLDAPKPSLYEWFDLRRVVRVKVAGQTWWGITTMISEVGAEVALTQAVPIPIACKNGRVKVEIVEERLELSGEIIQTGLKDEFSTIRVAFAPVSINQHRRLVEMLFCRPGQWKCSRTPGELSSLLLLLRILLKPRILFGRGREATAIALAKV